MTGLRVLHVVPGDLGVLSEWPDIIDYAATAGTGQTLESGAPVFNAIWISPFCERTDAYTYNKYPRRGSLYAIKNHLSVDPAFSTLPAGDLRRPEKDLQDIKDFCEQAEVRGIRVMADLVLNHVAADHPWAIKERQDLNAIQTWGKELRVHVKQGKFTFDCYPWEVHPERGDFAITGISYIPEGDCMPGTRQEDGRIFYPLLFRYKLDMKPVVDSSLGQEWSDVAKINYQCPEARALFLDLWKAQIDWLLSAGVSGFRCDAAYKIDQDIWSEVIQHSHDRYGLYNLASGGRAFSEPVWLAETLGGTPDEVNTRIGKARILRNGKVRPAFDNGMLWTHWWEGKRIEYADTALMLQSVTRFGGLGVPDNHDTVSTLAVQVRKSLANRYNIAAGVDAAVSNYCFNKAVMSLILGATGICMELGYLRCVEQQATIFDEPAVTKRRKDACCQRPAGHPLNLEKRFWHVVNYFDSLTAHGLVPCFDRVDFATSTGDNGGLLRYTIDLHEANKHRNHVGTVTIFINPSPENGGDRIDADNPDHLPGIKNTVRLVLGPGDSPIQDDNGRFLTVNDLAIYTNISRVNISKANTPQAVSLSP